MFEIELLELLNKYRKTDDNYEQQQIKDSISNLISQNQEAYQAFLDKPTLDNDAKQLLKQCEKTKYENDINKDNNVSEANSDFENIKKFYRQWLSYYQNNDNQVNENCDKIVEDILNFYMLNRFYILQKVLAIEDTQDFESFKNHINNKIRLFYLKKIDDYMNTEEYEKMFFLQKIRKKNQINSLLEDLAKYHFDSKRFEEVLE